MQVNEFKPVINQCGLFCLDEDRNVRFRLLFLTRLESEEWKGEIWLKKFVLEFADSSHSMGVEFETFVDIDEG